LWIIGSAIQFISIVKVISAQSLNLAIMRKHSPVVTRVRGWATLLSPVSFIVSSVLIILRSICYAWVGDDVYEPLGVVLWIVGFSVWILGSV
jgi:hypothetical protein